MTGFAPLDDLVGKHLAQIGDVVHASILNDERNRPSSSQRPPRRSGGSCIDAFLLPAT
jgi:hypothetical protein